MAVIWQRTINHEVHKTRWQKFARWYLAPAGLAALVGLILGGVGAFLGIMIFAVLLGSLIATWLWITIYNESQNPEIVHEGTELRCGKQTIPLEQVARFATYHTRGGPNSPDGGRAAFHLMWTNADGSPGVREGKFTWTHMPESELAGVTAVLDQVLPGRRVTLEQFRQPMG